MGAVADLYSCSRPDIFCSIWLRAETRLELRNNGCNEDVNDCCGGGGGWGGGGAVDEDGTWLEVDRLNWVLNVSEPLVFRHLLEMYFFRFLC